MNPGNDQELQSVGDSSLSTSPDYNALSNEDKALVDEYAEKYGFYAGLIFAYMLANNIGDLDKSQSIEDINKQLTSFLQDEENERIRLKMLTKITTDFAEILGFSEPKIIAFLVELGKHVYGSDGKLTGKDKADILCDIAIITNINRLDELYKKMGVGFIVSLNWFSHIKSRLNKARKNYSTNDIDIWLQASIKKRYNKSLSGKGWTNLLQDEQKGRSQLDHAAAFLLFSYLFGKYLNSLAAEMQEMRHNYSNAGDIYLAYFAFAATWDLSFWDDPFLWMDEHNNNEFVNSLIENINEYLDTPTFTIPY